jgi:hypothetical protein
MSNILEKLDMKIIVNFQRNPIVNMKIIIVRVKLCSRKNKSLTAKIIWLMK